MEQTHYRTPEGEVVHYSITDETEAEAARLAIAEAPDKHWRKFFAKLLAEHEAGILHRQRLALGLTPARAEDCACYYGRGCGPV